MGHRIRLDHSGLVKTVTKEFPHVCPGEDCAVAEFLINQARKDHYERLRGRRRPTATRCD